MEGNMEKKIPEHQDVTHSELVTLPAAPGYWLVRCWRDDDDAREAPITAEEFSREPIIAWAIQHELEKIAGGRSRSVYSNRDVDDTQRRVMSTEVVPIPAAGQNPSDLRMQAMIEGPDGKLYWYGEEYETLAAWLEELNKSRERSRQWRKEAAAKKAAQESAE
jgi:hypothetical protein